MKSDIFETTRDTLCVIAVIIAAAFAVSSIAGCAQELGRQNTQEYLARMAITKAAISANYREVPINGSTYRKD